MLQFPLDDLLPIGTSGYVDAGDKTLDADLAGELLQRSFCYYRELVVFVFVAAGVGTAQAAAGGEQPQPDSPRPARPVHRVFIPVDENGQPTGARYYVPQEIFNQLHRREAAARERTRLINEIIDEELVGAADKMEELFGNGNPLAPTDTVERK